MLTNLFNWAIALNLGIGAINLLPLGIMDGGRMFELALTKHIKNKKTRLKVWKTVSGTALFLLLMNLVGPYIF
jgi:membrane-associated protease RseP (regulator of RpoE activity)